MPGVADGDPDISARHHQEAETAAYHRSEPSVTIDRDVLPRTLSDSSSLQAELARAQSELASQRDAAWQEGHVSAQQRTGQCFGPTHGVIAALCGCAVIASAMIGCKSAELYRSIAEEKKLAAMREKDTELL